MLCQRNLIKNNVKASVAILISGKTDLGQKH